jgi:hypothetical protein
MNKQNQIPPALKHGAYSGITLLPGEDPVSFKKLHDELVIEFDPVGPLEEDIVGTIARLTWRKQNLSTYRVAQKAKSRLSEIRNVTIPKLELPDFLSNYDSRDPNEIRAAEQAAEAKARKELGPVWELIAIGEASTTDYLLNELSIMDRLDGMIDRCLKRLLFVRGLKSLPASSSEAPASSRKKLSAA